MNRQSGLLVACTLILIGTANVQAQSAVKIGVFDPLRVSQETAEGQGFSAQLKLYFDQKQAEVTSKEQALLELQKQAQTQALSLSEAKRAELERNIQRKLLDLNSFRETAMKELQLEQAEVQSRFEQQLLRVVDQYARQNGFALILDRSAVVWAADGIDVTTGLVDLFNQMVPAGGEASPGD